MNCPGDSPYFLTNITIIYYSKKFNDPDYSGRPGITQLPRLPAELPRKDHERLGIGQYPFSSI